MRIDCFVISFEYYLLFINPRILDSYCFFFSFISSSCFAFLASWIFLIMNFYISSWRVTTVWFTSSDCIVPIKCRFFVLGSLITSVPIRSSFGRDESLLPRVPFFLSDSNSYGSRCQCSFFHFHRCSRRLVVGYPKADYAEALILRMLLFCLS